MSTGVDRETWEESKAAHRWQGVMLLASMAVLTAAPGWLLAGPEGAIWSLGAALLSYLIAPNAPTPWVMRLHRAVPLTPQQAPGLYRRLEAIARRAELDWPPRLYYLPSRALNAFAVGEDGQAAIALTDGLLHRLDERELAGVLAHEVSHIRNRDTRIMTMADAFRRVASAGAMVGQWLVLAVLFLLMVGGYEARIAWPAFLLLILAPTISGLLQLAFSRTRELQADLDAVALTGDPEGLASALNRLHQRDVGFWQRLWRSRSMGGEWLSTHPDPDERINRLLSLRPARHQPQWIGSAPTWGPLPPVREDRRPVWG